MNLAYFDCFSGAGGDMIVGALIDAGADAQVLRQRLESLGLEGYSLTIEKVKKQGFAATRFWVELDASAPQPHRHLKHIRQILEAGQLEAPVKARALRIFTRLAEAEAAVHGTTPEKVHFHEVGAVDAIVDVVGAVLALDLLEVREILCGPVPVGSGTVRCDHGVMPIPAPATAELLRGVPIRQTDEVGELTTPTAAAVFTSLAAGFRAMPAMAVRSIGYGAGTRDGQFLPNVLRVFIGERVTAEGVRPEEKDGAEHDEIVVLETNLDDASPQVIGYCVARLLREGALDAYTVPIQMKKGRPGVVLTVLCTPASAENLERIVFEETPTLGIRRRPAMRTRLPRRMETVETEYGTIRMKIGRHADLTTAQPEYEDCKAVAQTLRIPLQRVMQAARMAWTDRRTNTGGEPGQTK